MSVDIVTKKRARAKKAVVEETVAAVGPTTATSSKTKGRQPRVEAAEGANESVVANEAATKRLTTTKKKAATPKKPSKTSTSKLSAKNSNDEAPLPPSSNTISMTTSKILPHADAFSQSAEVSTDIIASSSTNPKVASTTKATSNVAQAQQYEPKLSPSTTSTPVTNSEGTLASQAAHNGANPSAAPSRKASKFMTSFFSDPEPAPTGGEAIQDEPPAQPTTKPADGKKKQTIPEALAKHQSQQHRSSTPPTDPRYDTLPAMKPYSTTSFVALKATPSIPKSFPSTTPRTAPAEATSVSSAPPQPKGISSAPITSTPPTPATPHSQATRSPGTNLPYAASPPTNLPYAASAPTHNVRLPLTQTTRPPRPSPIKPTPPPRPTTLPLSELKRQPEFRRKSRQWIMLIVGLPVLIGTSWELFQRDYAKKSGARYEFKGWIAAGNDIWGAAVGKGGQGERKFRESHTEGEEGVTLSRAVGISGEDGSDIGREITSGEGRKRLLEEK